MQLSDRAITARDRPALDLTATREHLRVRLLAPAARGSQDPWWSPAL